jgi:hypothetical protein
MAYVCAKGFPNINGNQPVIEATTMVMVLVTVFSFGTFTISALQTLKIQTGIPANDAVNLSANQSKLLALEQRYLLPFLHRKLALGRQGHAAAHAAENHGEMAGGEERGEGGEEGGQGAHSPVGRGGLERRGSISGSFMHNDLIDGLFRRDSMAVPAPAPAAGGGAGGGSGGGSGGGGGLSSSPVLGSKSSMGNSSSSGGGVFGEGFAEEVEEEADDGQSARVV